jgi:hypothetical protein
MIRARQTARRARAGLGLERRFFEGGRDHRQHL